MTRAIAEYPECPVCGRVMFRRKQYFPGYDWPIYNYTCECCGYEEPAGEGP